MCALVMCLFSRDYNKTEIDYSASVFTVQLGWLKQSHLRLKGYWHMFSTSLL